MTENIDFSSLSEGLVTESDVEQKLIYPLLSRSDLLAYNFEEIKTKEYITPTNIDKGAGKRKGYYPDYMVVLSSLCSIVVEAKSPNETAEEGVREAQLYAHEINKRFPTGLNPVQWIISTNGKDLIYGNWDSEDLEKVEIKDFVHGAAALENFKAACSRSSVLPVIEKIRSELAPARRFKPLRFLGGPSRQNTELPTNRFSVELIPLLKRYFDPDATRHSKSIIEKAYVSSREITNYNAVLEALLKDNIGNLKFPNSSQVTTSKTDAPEINKKLRELIEADSIEKEPLLLLIGSVGAGKSIFLERYYYHLMAADLGSRTRWIFIDLNEAPSDLSQLSQWIVGQALKDFPIRNNVDNFHGYHMLRRFFAPQIRKREFGPYAILKKTQPEEFERRISEDLANWQDDSNMLLDGVMRFYGGDQNFKIVVAFDNADRRNAEQQLAIFQEVQHFRSKYKCLCILSLRDETYDRYRNEPPLDAFFKPFAFRISPPRFVDVIKRRLELTIEYLTDEAPGSLKYVLPNEMEVTYPATELGHYLFGVYLSLFNPTRRVRLILESLSGRDVRYALQMFCDILMSGYMTDDRIFKAHYHGEEVFIPEWLIIKILMRTKYKYYSENHGYTVNVFAVDEDSTSASNFLLVDILSLLCRDRKKQGELGIEGYRLVTNLLDELSKCGYIREDVFWALLHLLKHRLVIADHQSTTSICEGDNVKITASGYCHITILLHRSEYLCNVALDTCLRDSESAKTISAFADSRSVNGQLRTLRAFHWALGQEAEIYYSQNAAPANFQCGPEMVFRALEIQIAELEERRS